MLYFNFSEKSVNFICCMLIFRVISGHWVLQLSKWRKGNPVSYSYPFSSMFPVQSITLLWRELFQNCWKWSIGPLISSRAQSRPLSTRISDKNQTAGSDGHLSMWKNRCMHASVCLLHAGQPKYASNAEKPGCIHRWRLVGRIRHIRRKRVKN